MSDTETISTTGAAVEDLSDYKDLPGIAERWVKELSLVTESKAQKDFERIGEDAIKIYKNSGSLADSASSRAVARNTINLLNSDVKVLLPTYYSRLPKVVAERTFKDSDPLGRLAAQVLERATQYCILQQQDRFNFAIRAAVQDKLLPGRGQVAIRYDAKFEQQTDDAGQPVGQPIRKPNSEEVVIEPLNWLDYFHSTARNPYEQRWRAKRVYMTRQQLVDRFGEKIGRAVELGDTDDEGRKRKISDGEREFLQQAEVFEIEDEPSKRRYWISKGYKDGPLDIKKDHLKLKGFFSFPTPLLATTTTDSSYPTADWKITESLSEQIETITRRIQAMVECIKFVGSTAESFNKDVKKMLALNDGELWPIRNWSKFVEAGGFKGVIDFLPFEKCVEAIPVLMQQRDDLLAKYDLIKGIPDIIRGSSDPNETAAAQQRKSHWVNVKTADDQRDVQRFIREIISKVGEIIVEPGLFADETIALMCGIQQMKQEDQQNYGAALQLLRDDRLRTFRLDIETDSTIAANEEEEKASRMEYFQTITSMTQSIEQIMTFRPELMRPLVEAGTSAAATFRNSRSDVGSWEKAWEDIEANDKAKAEQAAMNPPPPDPQMMALQIEQQKVQNDSQDMQRKMQESQAKLQGDAMKVQAEMQKIQVESQVMMERLSLDARKIQGDFELGYQKLQIEAAKVQSSEQIEATNQELEAFKLKFTQYIEQQRLELEKFTKTLDIQERFTEEKRLAGEQAIEVARVHNERRGIENERRAIEKKPKPSASA